MSLSALRQAEKQNIERVAIAESMALEATATALSNAILTAIKAGSDSLSQGVLDDYSRLYVDALRLAGLLGMYHVVRLVDSAIELNTAQMAVQFEEAIAYLESQVPTDSQVYRDYDANLRLRGFTVAAVSGEDAIRDVQALYADALKSGRSAPEVMQDVDQLLERAGVAATNPYYLELHYRNNMMSSYNGGRWLQIADNELVEYLIYLSVLDDGTTELCRHLDNVTKPKNDPFWTTYYPPNHHKCRGIVSPLSGPQYEAIPSDVAAQSGRVSASEILQNPTMQAEHQFTSSPVNTMLGLPSSLLTRAREYGQEPLITEYSASASADLLRERIGVLRATPVTRQIIERAVSGDAQLAPLSEMLARVPSEAESAVLAFESLGADAEYLAVNMIRGTGDGRYMITWAPAYAPTGWWGGRIISAEELRIIQSRGTALDLPGADIPALTAF